MKHSLVFFVIFSVSSVLYAADDTSKEIKMPEIFISVKDALKIEYRFTSRAQEYTDFKEGIRSMIIDKDRNPVWKYSNIEEVPIQEVFDLLKPLSSSSELKI